MRIATVIGKVTLSRSHESFGPARLLLAVPLSADELSRPADWTGESLVVWDELGGGTGSLIAVSEGREAAQPFHPQVRPVDAYNAALLDDLHW